VIPPPSDGMIGHRVLTAMARLAAVRESGVRSRARVLTKELWKALECLVLRTERGLSAAAGPDEVGCKAALPLQSLQRCKNLAAKAAKKCVTRFGGTDFQCCICSSLGAPTKSDSPMHLPHLPHLRAFELQLR